MTKTIEINQLPADVAALIQVFDVGSFSEPLRGPVHDEIVVGIQENFFNSTSYEGVAWPARKRLGDGHPLLLETGALYQQATAGQTEMTDRELAMTAALPYVRVHELGWEEKHIPARPYMGASEKHLERVGEILAEHLDKLVAGT